MNPLLSTQDTDVIYLALGEYSEDRFEIEREFYPSERRYVLTIDMKNKIVRTAVPLDGRTDWFNGLISCGFSWYLKALVGPCDDEGIPVKKKKRLSPIKKKLMMKRLAGPPILMKQQLMMWRRRHVPMKKKPRMEKLLRC
jgi:hypothetical protein